jgi:DNA-binding MarR family transcriptional regulator
VKVEPAEAAGAILETIPPAMRAIRQQMRAGVVTGPAAGTGGGSGGGGGIGGGGGTGGGRAEGLSVPQFRLLVFVRRHPGTSLSPVAEHLGTSLPAASQQVERLVRAGLLSRTPSPAERRRVELDLTETGRRILSDRDERTRAWLSERLAGLAPERLERLLAALADLRSVVLDEGAAGERAEGPAGEPATAPGAPDCMVKPASK